MIAGPDPIGIFRRAGEEVGSSRLQGDKTKLHLSGIRCLPGRVGCRPRVAGSHPAMLCQYREKGVMRTKCMIARGFTS